MAVSTPVSRSSEPLWPWKIGLILETPGLKLEIERALATDGVQPAFSLAASTQSFEVAQAVEHETPDILFVEFPRVPSMAADWMADVCRSADPPLVIAVHSTQEPAEMIAALRAGASEFLSPPIEGALHEAMERVGTLLEARRTATVRRGRLIGVLSAKGGCGATSVTCYLGAALSQMSASERVLVADVDWQVPAAHRVFRIEPKAGVSDAYQMVRRLNSSSWRECVSPVPGGPDLLAAPLPGDSQPPDEWRAESLFRFVSRQYHWVLVDMGRHLSPANWIYLQHIDDLIVVTAPDVLALYQTRAILQTLAGRGFDKSRVRIVLNQTYPAPQDFWVESIQQMFEIGVFALLPHDSQTLSGKAAGGFEVSPQNPFGRSIRKFAEKLMAAESANQSNAAQAKKNGGGLRKGLGL